MLKFHPYSILTGDTMVGSVIFCVLIETFEKNIKAKTYWKNGYGIIINTGLIPHVLNHTLLPFWQFWPGSPLGGPFALGVGILTVRGRVNITSASGNQVGVILVTKYAFGCNWLPLAQFIKGTRIVNGLKKKLYRFKIYFYPYYKIWVGESQEIQRKKKWLAFSTQ